MPSSFRLVSASDELLAAVDVVGRTGQGRVRHQVDGERGDVLGADHTSDRQRLAQLLVGGRRAGRRGATPTAACRRTRPRSGSLGWARARARGSSIRAGPAAVSAAMHRVARRRAPTAGAAHEEQCPSRAHLARRVAGDLDRQQEMRLDVAARLVEVELGQRRVVGAGPRDQHVVDRRRQLAEEPLEPVEVGGVECRRAARAQLRSRRARGARDRGPRGRPRRLRRGPAGRSRGRCRRCRR